jgi:3-methyladenine DNA glycosylase/8-oxoguanine DNA glycosylase
VVRQRSAKPSSAGSIPAVASNITVPPDFSFPATVTSHGWYRLAPFRWDGTVLRRMEVLDGRVVELAISATRGSLRIEGAEDSHELRRRITRMFQLDVDIAEFVAMTRASATHQWVEAAGFGHLLCGATLWEDIVKIIATTNVTWSQTVRMVELLVAKCGPGGAFPSPHDVARFSERELQDDCRLGYRAKTIRALASGIVDGSIDLDAIRDPRQSTAELFASYKGLPGIGPYGAAHLLAMDGRHDFIAVDTEFRRFVREKYHGGRRVEDATLLRRYKRWGRWQYLAYWSELREP